MYGFSIKYNSKEGYVNVDLKQSNKIGKEDHELNQIKTRTLSKLIF